MRKKLAVLAAVLCLASLALPITAHAVAVGETTASPEPALVWHTDYAAALKQAKAENRRVFLFFTGSDWCPFCKQMTEEILSKPEFAKYSKEKLILVEIDFPRKHKLPAKIRAQNDKLADKYNLQIYPTMIVLASDGAKVGELRYQEGGPGPFIARLEKL